MAELKNVYSGEAVEAALQFVAMGVGGFLEKNYGTGLLDKMPEDLQRAVMSNTAAGVKTRQMKQMGMAGILGALTHIVNETHEHDDEAQEKPSDLEGFIEGLLKALKEDVASKKSH